jgi:phosphatidylserine decarboxylase
MTKLYDRKTKEVTDISQYGSAGLRFLYGNPLGRLFLKPLTGHFCSKLYGKYMHSKLSRKKIPKFIEKNKLNIENPEQYQSFSEFFTRSEERNVEKDKNALIAPADSKLLVYGISDKQLIHIKYSDYSLIDLTGMNLDKYKGGHCLVFRLSVDDYHHYCFIDDGEYADQKHIKGKLHTVSSFSDKYPVFAQNDRVVNILKTKNFGEVVQIEVGAMLVGLIKNKKVDKFKRGEEKSYFDFGGSTVVLLVDKNVKIDKDILEQSKRGIETKLSYGERIGEKC